eukprot:Tbor_TRINITY_DN4084_c0_g1::TRINITY_DN4084_c0_g1_i1::g.11809::m.11809
MSVINNNKFAILSTLSEKKKTVVVNTTGVQHSKPKKEKNDNKDKTITENSNKKADTPSATSGKNSKKDSPVQKGCTLSLLKAEAKRKQEEDRMAAIEEKEVPAAAVADAVEAVEGEETNSPVKEGDSDIKEENGEAKDVTIDNNGTTDVPTIVEEEKPQKIVKSMADFEAERRARAIFVQAHPRTRADISNVDGQGVIMLSKSEASREIKVEVTKHSDKTKKQVPNGKENSKLAASTRGKGASKEAIKIEQPKKAAAPEKISLTLSELHNLPSGEKGPTDYYKNKSRSDGYRRTNAGPAAPKLDVNSETQFPSL